MPIVGPLSAQSPVWRQVHDFAVKSADARAGHRANDREVEHDRLSRRRGRADDNVVAPIEYAVTDVGLEPVERLKWKDIAAPAVP